MLTKEYLERAEDLFMIASSIGLDTYGYDDNYEETGLINDERLISDILAKQGEIVCSLPPGLFEEAIAQSDELREEVYILKKDSTYEVVSRNNLDNYGYSLMFPNGFNPPRNNPGWTIVLEVGEQYSED